MHTKDELRRNRELFLSKSKGCLIGLGWDADGRSRDAAGIFAAVTRHEFISRAKSPMILSFACSQPARCWIVRAIWTPEAY